MYADDIVGCFSIYKIC